MYLAQSQKENNVAFYIESLDKKVFTWEGLCYLIYTEPELLTEVVDKGLYLEWLQTLSGCEAIALTMEACYKDNGLTLSKMIKMLSLCQVTAGMDLELFVNRYEAYIEQPLYMRHKWIGDRYVEIGKWKKALGCYESSLSVQKDVRCYNNIGVVYMYQMNPERALHYFEKGILFKDDIELRLNKVKALWVMKRHDELLDYLEESIKVFDDWRFLRYYGMTFEITGRKEESLAGYMRYYEKSKNKKVLIAIVRLEAKLNGLERANHIIDQLSEALTKKEQLYLQAQACRHTGDYRSYEHYMEHLIKMPNSSTEDLLELSRVYVSQGELIKAIGIVGKIDIEDQNREEVKAQKALIASTAGNRADFECHVEAMTDLWKKSFRTGITP